MLKSCRLDEKNNSKKKNSNFPAPAPRAVVEKHCHDGDSSKPLVPQRPRHRSPVQKKQPTNQPNPTLLIPRSLASDEFCMPQKTRKFKWKQNSTRHVSAAVFGYIITFLFLHQEMSESKSENCPPWQLPWHSHFELIEHTNVQLLQVLAGQAGPSYLAQCRAPFVTLKMTA